MLKSDFCKRLALYLVLGLLIRPFTSHGQGIVDRVWNYMFNDTTHAEKPKFMAYPTIAYAPETKWEFGLSALYVYYMNQDTSNRLSELNLFTFLTLEQQYGLWLDHALYGDQSKWFFLGKVRLQQFPLFYYGIGPEITGEELAQIDAGSLAIRERVLRKVWGSLYLGLETDFQRLANVQINQFSEDSFHQPPGAMPYLNLGLGLGLVYDNRHNVLNVREGFFGETGFLRYDNAWWSDYEFTSYFLDARYYLTTAKNQVLASQVYFTDVVREAPFNQLALMGGESLMRGYYTGRYRDKTLLAAQTEYRFLPFPFSRRWGAATFLGMGTVGNRLQNLDFKHIKIAGGLGARFLLFPNKDIYTRFDIAFSEDGPGYYFFIGEAF
ncbi:BamA/TamA family outer membrane protein [Marinoscillum pacificum]|uniref:BamA/TamA family outer membrane protein n=1 Tax=Marinoscillum pacificum TaxID=392723 RepID=UPI0021580C9E|nr:BamA/TamA family outer membrane protein [Marinoscillum pacificum]